MYSILFLAGTSFVLCFLLTPLVTALSRRAGVIDHPNSTRKLHVSAVPRTGGVAVFVSYLAAIGLLLLLPLNAVTSVNLPMAVRLVPAVAVIFGLGLLDDVIGLNAWKKLTGQVIAAVVAFSYGGVQVLSFGGHAAPAWASLPITVGWLVLCANAFNLIDGVDGLATGLGLSATCTTLAAALLYRNAPLALATAPLVGALLAFLRYNFNPATIFLGDCGSLTMGFLLGCFGAIWSQKSETLFGMAAPLMALAVPLLDTAMAVVRRFVRHQPIFSPDRNHIHHRLLARGFSPRKVALVLYGACGVAAAFSILVSMPDNHLEGLLIVLFGVAIWFAVQMAGYVEFDAARHLILSGAFREIVNARLFVNHFEEQLDGAVTAEDYWRVIRDASREIGCTHVRVSLAGSIFEEVDVARARERSCTIRIPLSEDDYVNFRYPSKSSVKHAVAISSIVALLQRALAAHVPVVARTPSSVAAAIQPAAVH